MRKLTELLDAPCLFCGYNGHDYWQKHSHHYYCPFYEVGGFEDREKLMPKLQHAPPKLPATFTG